MRKLDSLIASTGHIVLNCKMQIKQHPFHSFHYLLSRYSVSTDGGPRTGLAAADPAASKTDAAPDPLVSQAFDK